MTEFNYNIDEMALDIVDAVQQIGAPQNDGIPQNFMGTGEVPKTYRIPTPNLNGAIGSQSQLYSTIVPHQSTTMAWNSPVRQSLSNAQIQSSPMTQQFQYMPAAKRAPTDLIE